MASGPCWRRRMSASPTPAPATGPRTGTIWDKPKPAVPWVPCPPRRPRPSSCIRCSATGRRFCSHPYALPAPARRPPHWAAHERLSRPLAPRLLSAYFKSAILREERVEARLLAAIFCVIGQIRNIGGWRAICNRSGDFWWQAKRCLIADQTETAGEILRPARAPTQLAIADDTTPGPPSR